MDYDKILYIFIEFHHISNEHCFKNVKRSDKEIYKNYCDNYLDTRELFLISDYTKMKCKMNVAILESFVKFYKNHSKIISLS